MTPRLSPGEKDRLPSSEAGKTWGGAGGRGWGWERGGGIRGSVSGQVVGDAFPRGNTKQEVAYANLKFGREVGAGD